MPQDKIPVIELFGPTMQGEGKLCGQISHFIRFGVCTYRCSWCFGVVPGRRVPKIITATSVSKNLPDICIGDVLLTFSEDKKELVETNVVEVHTRFVDTWLRIKIDGTQYFVTKEHPFFTARGLIKAQDLVVGDMILHSSPQEKSSWAKRGAYNPMRRPEVATKSTANTDYEISRQAMREWHKKAREEGRPVGFASWSEERKAEFAKFLSDSRKRENNPNWQGGISRPVFMEAKKRIAGKLLPCDRCSIVAKLEVHHKDENYDNDTLENFEYICHSCHSKEHQRGYNFWQGERKDGKRAYFADGDKPRPKNGKEVQAIKVFDRSKFFPSVRPAPLRVYNLTCSPHDSYLVDYMWVHNCDSLHAVLPKQIKKHAKYQTQEEICNDLMKLGEAPWVTLTGGDPCVWDLMELCYLLREEAGFKLAVETQGAFYQEWLACADLVTCSPKPPSSGMVSKFKPEVIQKYVARLSSRMIFKIVIFTEEDLEWARRIHKWMPKVLLYLSVGTPTEPNGIIRHTTNIMDKYRWLVERIFKLPELHDAVILPQMHALLWGRELGR